MTADRDDIAAETIFHFTFEPLAHLIDPPEEFLRLFDDRISQTAGEWVSAERRAVMTRLHQAFECRSGDDCAEWQSAAERLRERDDVRDDAALLKREHRSEPAEAALDLVVNEDRARLIGETSSGDQEIIGEWNDATFAHDRLEENRR